MGGLHLTALYHTPERITPHNVGLVYCIVQYNLPCSL